MENPFFTVEIDDLCATFSPVYKRKNQLHGFIKFCTELLYYSSIHLIRRRPVDFSVHLFSSIAGGAFFPQLSVSSLHFRARFILYCRFHLVPLRRSDIQCKIAYNVNGRWFSSEAMADVAAGGNGNGNGIVGVPLAQTGEGIAECELLKWFVREGDQVDEFQPLCEVQSDKATIEITSRYLGKVSQLLYVPGDIVKVGEILLKMAVEESQVPKQICESLENTKLLDSELNTHNIGGVLSTPPVRNLAKQFHIDINEGCGTGKDGRVLKEDVIKYAAQKGIIEVPSVSLSASPEKALGGEDSYAHTSAESRWNYDYKTVTLRGFQRRMVQSMSMAAKVPHFHYVEDIKCDALVELKNSFQSNNTDSNVKHTFLPLLIKTLSMAMNKYPLMNSSFNEESLEVTLKGSHNIGIAMATPYGLVVPIIKNVQSLSILEITMELSRLLQLAMENKLKHEDISDGAITLSNIGAIGGKYGSPLLSLPEVAIIAIGRMHKVPRFADDGTLHPVSVMTVNIGADHRVLDGATVARFCNEWKQFIENPELLMLRMR
ncbi:lipoamide acyltransferase component of branched-chain alpha-keto acid dehydrogenase complex, mitochondrial-like isoform X2 [Malus sylvestris]|uniref:lipoamide acyltransferase component of branched-chain alpha-keto acid dehydrogenase complex, mitochondrial-like isoform X2 n=1 Tax=Malus sylvestris TaxID=3752 RepID=UPI0021ACEBC7|nr:lipoamide acyltransferase component of branched-chain alpha-keto acid dehydrogenase complex, mitochondrial-like isoform X2 [Malus sylvestris]